MRVERAHRPTIIGKKGAVASNHPVATQAGLDVLRAGGTAVDAAIAVSLTLGVVEPHMSGLGGDGFYHTFNASSGKGTVYNGSGVAPSGSRAAVSDAMPFDGPRSISVPGAVSALGLMHRAEGTLDWERLVTPAITAARDGFGVTHVYQRFVGRTLARILSNETSTNIFLRQRAVPELGDYVVQENLACTLELLAREGTEGFYRGVLAERLAADFTKAGIPIHASDLRAYSAELQQPVSTTYRGHEVRQTPPNSTGFVLLEALKIVERFDLNGYSQKSADLAHILVEAKKLAFVDRERYAGDPRFIDIPLTWLLSEENIKALSAQICLDQAALRPVRPNRGEGNTTFFCVVDSHGNAVSAIQSLNNTFGSGVTLSESGILMNNRMNCWHLDSNHPNNLLDGKRVRHTMNAPMVIKNGKVWAIFGTPGADDQVQVNLQIAVGLIDFDQDPQSLVEAPRWSSSQPGQDANWPHGGSDVLSIEAGFSLETKASLAARGHAIREVPDLEGTGSVACIRVLENGSYIAASDPRRDGWAGAF